MKYRIEQQNNMQFKINEILILCPALLCFSKQWNSHWFSLREVGTSHSKKSDRWYYWHLYVISDFTR